NFLLYSSFPPLSPLWPLWQMGFTMYGLSPADAAVLLAYLLRTTALGIWVDRRARSVAEYFMPRKFSKPVMIMYAFGTGTASHQAALVAPAAVENHLAGSRSRLRR